MILKKTSKLNQKYNGIINLNNEIENDKKYSQKNSGVINLNDSIEKDRYSRSSKNDLKSTINNDSLLKIVTINLEQIDEKKVSKRISPMQRKLYESSMLKVYFYYIFILKNHID